MTKLWSNKCCTDAVSFLSPNATPWVCVLYFNAESWLWGITTQSIDFVGELSSWEIVALGFTVAGLSTIFSPKSIFLDSLIFYFASDRCGNSWTLSTGCWLKISKTFFAFAPKFTTLFFGIWVCKRSYVANLNSSIGMNFSFGGFTFFIWLIGLPLSRAVKLKRRLTLISSTYWALLSYYASFCFINLRNPCDSLLRKLFRY